MPQSLKLYGEEAQAQAIKLSVQGMSHRTISYQLNAEFNLDLTKKNVSDFLIKQKKKIFSYAIQDKKLQGKLAEEYFDSVGQIKELNHSLWEFFYEIKETPELKDKIISCKKCGSRQTINIQSYGLLLKTADHILKQIEHVDKCLHRRDGSPMKVEHNFPDMIEKINRILPELFHRAEELGDIRILNRKKYKKIN